MDLVIGLIVFLWVCCSLLSLFNFEKRIKGLEDSSTEFKDDLEIFKKQNDIAVILEEGIRGATRYHNLKDVVFAIIRYLNLELLHKSGEPAKVIVKKKVKK